jgi:hypothetical protein
MASLTLPTLAARAIKERQIIRIAEGEPTKNEAKCTRFLAVGPRMSIYR